MDQQAQASQTQGDQMNLDDFIFTTSIASPAGLSPSPSASTDGPSHMSSTNANAIPIKKQSGFGEDHHLARASAPSVPPTGRNISDFSYVQRHVRKTSIDERRVRACPLMLTLSKSLPWQLVADKKYL